MHGSDNTMNCCYTSVRGHKGLAHHCYRHHHAGVAAMRAVTLSGYGQVAPDTAVDPLHDSSLGLERGRGEKEALDRRRRERERGGGGGGECDICRLWSRRRVRRAEMGCLSSPPLSCAFSKPPGPFSPQDWSPSPSPHSRQGLQNGCSVAERARDSSAGQTTGGSVRFKRRNGNSS